MERNLCKRVISNGGKLITLMIPSKDSKGLGLMNPSILIDNDKILLNIRNINYTLYHCEGQQLFNTRWGPLSYMHPENDIHLRTWNFMCELSPINLEVDKYWLTDTSTLDKSPLWDFVGLEDARLVRWNGKLYQCGVRRDTTPNGQGRMELSEIFINDEHELQENESKYKEISRTRIEPPGPPTYCEKNWMPVLDMPFHFVKWTNPTQVVKVNLETKTSETVYLSDKTIPNMPDFRGGSQVITYKNYRICLIHEVNLLKNKLRQKDATYKHRFIIWDKNWNIVKMSDSFSFMDGEIEFCCGMTLYKEDLLITFGFQDNAAFLLRIPSHMIDDIIGLNLTKRKLDWGNSFFKNTVNNEIFIKDVYQKYFKVEKDDIVVDVGASVGPFTYSILNKEPKHVFCIEPSKDLFPILKNNVKNDFVTCINKGIGNVDGETKFLNLFERSWHGEKQAESIKFSTFIKEYKIEKIDFLKIDCEGGEYDIFNEENFEWIKKNVKKIATEFHICSPYLKERFKHFRDLYLKQINFKVTSIHGDELDIDLWNDDFKVNNIIMIYINNYDKFENFPDVYYVSFINNTDRREILEKQFEKYGITAMKMISTEESDKQNIANIAYKDQLDKGSVECTISHLKTIKNWYENTSSPYMIVFEDDVLLETSENWNFTWKEFMNNLPSDWDCIQLCTIRKDFKDVKLRKREWDDWSITAYMISRNYAKRLLEEYYNDGVFNLKMQDASLLPLPENIIYLLGNTYVFPLFTENLKFETTFKSRENDEEHISKHKYSSKFIIDWWKTNGKISDIKDLMKM